MLCACPHLKPGTLCTKTPGMTQPSADGTHFTSLLGSIFVMSGSEKVSTAHGLSLSNRPEVHMINKNDMQSHEGRTKLIITCHGHGQNGWFPIGCAGLCFHGMYKTRVSVSGWSPNGCEGVYTNLNIPCPLHSLLL